MKQTLATLLKFVSTLALLGGVALIIIASTYLTSGTIGSSLAAIGAGCLMIVAAAICLGVAKLVTAAHRSASDGLPNSIQQIQSQLTDLQRRIDDVAVTADRLSKIRPTSIDDRNSSSAVQFAPLIEKALQPAMQMLNELRDLSLLTDEERKRRMLIMDEERMQVLLRDANEHIGHRRWSAADHSRLTLEHEFGTEDEVRRARHYFEDARRNAEIDSVNEARDQVEELLNVSSYDKAHQLASRLCSDFPGSVVSQSLLNRVVLERDTFNETSIARMIDELRHDVDRKLWRRALMHLHHLIEKYPDHPKVKKVSGQLTTVRANAEIEERQELEVQIQELIRNREFGEAIHLSEELLRRYPDSPQAEAIETLLPRIRELEREDETDVPATY